MRRLWLVCAGLLVGCAHLAETTQLRAIPVEPPRVQTMAVGKALGIEGARQGDAVHARIFEVQLCVDERHQNARGVRETTRSSVGQSLVLEWTFGGLFTATAAAVTVFDALRPPVDDKSGVSSKTSVLPYAIGLGAVGSLLLAGAGWQTASLGVHEDDLGVRELVVRSPERPCGRQPASGGRARLTLASGLQLEAEAGADGALTLPLPASVTDHLATGRRATLEALGDARAQVRISL